MIIYRAFLETQNGNVIAVVPISQRYKLQINCGNKSIEEIKQFLQQKILEQIQRLSQQGIKLDSPHEIDSKENVHSLNVEVPINFQFKRGFFEKAIPVLGHFSNVLAILCLGFVSYLAMRVTTGEQNDTAKSLNFAGAIFTLIITFLIYVFSGASQGLAAMGRKIDEIFLEDRIINTNQENLLEDQLTFNEQVLILPVIPSADFKSSTRKSLEGLGAAAAVLINAGITGITTFQQVKALGDKAIQPDEKILYNIQLFLPFVLVISAGISNPAFQWSFIRDALSAITGIKCNCTSNNEESKRLSQQSAVNAEPTSDEQQALTRSFS